MLISNVIEQSHSFGGPLFASFKRWSSLYLGDVFTAQPGKAPPKNRSASYTKVRGYIRFEDVTFRYDQEEETRNAPHKTYLEV